MIGGEGALKAVDEDDEDEYVEKERNGEDAPFEGPRMCVEVENIEVGFGSQGSEKGRKFWGRWIKRGVQR